MRVQIRFQIITDDDDMISEDESARFDKPNAQLDEIGLSLAKAKTLLDGVVPPPITWTPEKGYGVVGLGCGLPT